MRCSSGVCERELLDIQMGWNRLTFTKASFYILLSPLLKFLNSTIYVVRYAVFCKSCILTEVNLLRKFAAYGVHPLPIREHSAFQIEIILFFTDKGHI